MSVDAGAARDALLDALTSWFSLALRDQDFAGFSDWRALAVDAMEGHPNGAAKNGIRPAIDAFEAAIRAEYENGEHIYAACMCDGCRTRYIEEAAIRAEEQERWAFLVNDSQSEADDAEAKLAALREALIGLDDAWRWVGEHYPVVLTEVPSLAPFDRARAALAATPAEEERT